jgi:hypothetical protein
LEYVKIQSIIVVNIIGESEFYGMLKVLKKYDNILILAFLMLLSVVFVIPLQAQHQIYIGDDMPYHINRIKELVANISQGNYFPQLYTYNFRDRFFIRSILSTNHIISICHSESYFKEYGKWGLCGASFL